MAALCHAALLCSCATTADQRAARDPFEKMNRGTFAFNDALDRHVMKPITDTYVRVAPAPVRKSVTHFFNNISEPDVAVNDFLQGKPIDGGSDICRFCVNTIIGILGLFDPATGLGLIRHDEDLGQTLGVWRVGEGPYLVLPLLGPRTLRDISGDVMSYAWQSFLFSSVSSAITTPLDALQIVDERAGESNALHLVDEAAVDRYVFTREAYRAKRISLIYDGNPPALPETPEETPASAPKQKTPAEGETKPEEKKPAKVSSAMPSWFDLHPAVPASFSR